MSEIVLEVHEREVTTKNANRRLRATGQVPAVVYGAGLDPAPIQVGQRKVEEILKSGSGGNTVFLLQLHGTQNKRHAMIRELQTDSVTDQMIHIDFQRVLMDQKVRVMVPIELVGEAEGVKTEESDAQVTHAWAETHLQIGIEAMTQIGQEGEMIRHFQY